MADKKMSREEAVKILKWAHFTETLGVTYLKVGNRDRFKQALSVLTQFGDDGLKELERLIKNGNQIHYNTTEKVFNIGRNTLNGFDIILKGKTLLEAIGNARKK